MLDLDHLRISAIISELPAGIGILTGENMIVELANEAILKLWGRDSSCIGKPLLEIMPEIAVQAFPKILNDVYTTGIPYFIQDAAVRLMLNGIMQTTYMDFSYTPLRDAGGKIESILVLGTDVTERTQGMQREQQLIEKLLAANEELSVTIEALKIANEELKYCKGTMQELKRRKGK